MLLRYCSERAPFEGVYLATTATKPSAKVLTAEVNEVKVALLEG